MFMCIDVIYALRNDRFFGADIISNRKYHCILMQCSDTTQAIILLHIIAEIKKRFKKKDNLRILFDTR